MALSITTLHFMIFEMIIAGASIFSGIITFRQFVQTKNRVFAYFGLDWTFWGVSWFLIAIAQLTSDSLYMRLSFIPQGIAVIFLILFVDHTLGQSVRPVRTAIWSALSVLQFAGAWMNGTIELIPNIGVLIMPPLVYVQYLFVFFYAWLFLTCFIRTAIAAPPQLRKNALRLLFGAFVMTIVSGVLYTFMRVYYLFGILAFAFHTYGILVILFEINHDPRLIYILPFVAHRICVIQRKSGLMVFEHRWSKFDLDKSILSGLIQALQAFSLEMLQVGDILDLNLKGGVIMLEHGKHYTFALLVSRRSQYLVECLADFAQAFEAQATEQKITDDCYVDSDRFLFAQELRNRHFKHIPERL